MFIKVTMAGAAKAGISDVGFINMAEVCAVTASADGAATVLVMDRNFVQVVTETPEEIMALLEQARQQAQRPAAAHIVTLPCQEDGKIVCMAVTEFRSARSVKGGSVVRYSGGITLCALAPAEVVCLIRGEA
jgi:hypothetical protein